MKVIVDNYTRFILTALTVLLAVVGLNLWFHTPSTIPTAQASIPDSGQQLYQLIEEVKALNSSVDQMKQTLTSGKIKVQIVQPKQKP